MRNRRVNVRLWPAIGLESPPAFRGTDQMRPRGNEGFTAHRTAAEIIQVVPVFFLVVRKVPRVALHIVEFGD